MDTYTGRIMVRYRGRWLIATPAGAMAKGDRPYIRQYQAEGKPLDPYAYPSASDLIYQSEDAESVIRDGQP